jgi:hypothetical protein
MSLRLPVSLDKSPFITEPLFMAPRLCNTGALIPKNCGTRFNTYKVDWLEMTVQDIFWEDFVIIYLGLHPNVFVLQDYGRHGYAQLYTYGAVQICCTLTRPERGTKVILPASALDEVAYDACYIIKKGLKDGASFARIDIAYDDYSSTLSYDFLLEKIQTSGELVTRFATVEPKCPFWLKGQRKGRRSGEGFVFGSSASARQLVIYNKRLEQEYRAIKRKEELPAFRDDFTWWRLEGRWHKAAALSLASEISENGLLNAGALLRGLIDFRDPETDTRTDRQHVASWWSDLLSSGDIIRTGVQKAVKTVEDKVCWLMRSCRKAMGQVATLVGTDVLSEIMQQGARDTTDKEWAQLRSKWRPLALERITFEGGCPF